MADDPDRMSDGPVAHYFLGDFGQQQKQPTKRACRRRSSDVKRLNESAQSGLFRSCFRDTGFHESCRESPPRDRESAGFLVAVAKLQRLERARLRSLRRERPHFTPEPKERARVHPLFPQRLAEFELGLIVHQPIVEPNADLSMMVK
jgi:hypothetical protein